MTDSTQDTPGPSAVYIPGEGVILPDGRFMTEMQVRAAVRLCSRMWRALRPIIQPE